MLISLICCAPVALTSSRYRVIAESHAYASRTNPFKGARITTVLWYGKRFMLATKYPEVLGQRTLLRYYVDVALKDAGYDVSLTRNPSAVRVLWAPAAGSAQVTALSRSPPRPRGSSRSSAAPRPGPPRPGRLPSRWAAPKSLPRQQVTTLCNRRRSRGGHAPSPWRRNRSIPHFRCRRDSKAGAQPARRVDVAP